MTIPKIYSNFNTWIDNQQQIAKMQNTYSQKELESNNEFQTLNSSTSNTFDINVTGVDRIVDSIENFFGMKKNEDTFLDKAGNFINNLFGLKNKENYNKNVAKLGQGELLEKDSDKNGSLSMDEYITAELADLEEDATIEYKAMTAAYSQTLFQVLDEDTSASDKNGELSAEELANFYKYVDKFENGTFVEEDAADGKINTEETSDLILTLVNEKHNEEELLNNYYKHLYAFANQDGFTYDLDNKDEMLAPIAQGEILTKDINKNGTIEKNEYVAYSVASLGKNATPEQKAEIATETDELFAGLHAGKGYLDIDDVIKSYKYADKKTIEDNEDGIIEANGVQKFASWFKKNSGNSEENLNIIYKEYLKAFN